MTPPQDKRSIRPNRTSSPNAPSFVWAFAIASAAAALGPGQGSAHDVLHDRELRVAQSVPGATPNAVRPDESAKPPKRQFHIGTIQTKAADDAKKAIEPSTNPDINSRNALPDPARPKRKARRTPASLLNGALASLKRNKVRRARRKLELLVARYPNSTEADTARRHLAHLYTAKDPMPGATGAVGTARPKSVTAAPETSPRRTAAVDTNNFEMSADANRPLPPINVSMSQRLGQTVGDRVFFAPNSDKLGAKARNVLRSQARWLKRRKSYFILVTGHADEPGNAAQNKKLSRSRAKAVRRELINSGVPGNRIRIKARGRSQHIATCATPVCAAQNRRVVTHILQSRPIHIRTNGPRATP